MFIILLHEVKFSILIYNVLYFTSLLSILIFIFYLSYTNFTNMARAMVGAL